MSSQIQRGFCACHIDVNTTELATWVCSLGCAKNRVDTEHLLGSLGIGVKTVASISQSKLVFLNTCAFIESATRESLRTIFEITKKIKRLKRKPLFVVAGCLPGRYGMAELAKEIPEVDLWLDTKNLSDWPIHINRALKLAQLPCSGRLFGGAGYAWLKIAEGCMRQCAYCTIPAIRGPLRSASAASILAEARAAVAAGAKELILVGQETTAWGRDLLQAQIGPRKLAQLLRELSQIPGLCWIRTLYLYPNAVNDELLQTMAEIGEPVLPYLDIPLQHSELPILRAMARPQRTDPRDLVDRIRKQLPKSALRTTLMTGFPGETDADFQKMCDFVRQMRFHNLGVFAFEPEEGTKAFAMSNQVEAQVRQERRDELMRIQAEISREILQEYEGQRLQVLVDEACHEQWPGLHKGHVWFQTPEADGITYISGPNVAPGEMLQAEIADAQIYDLSALA